MMSIAKVHCEQSDDLDVALRSISERWNGDLSAYLKSMAEAKRNAKEDESLTPSAATFSRLARRR